MKVIWFDDYVFFHCTDLARRFANGFNGSRYATRGQTDITRIRQQVFESKLVEILLTMDGNYDLEPNGLSHLKPSQKSHHYDIVNPETKKGFHVKQSSDLGGYISYVFEMGAFGDYALYRNFMLCTLDLKNRLLHAHAMDWGEIEPLLKETLAKFKTKRALYEKDLPESAWVREGDPDVEIWTFPQKLGNVIGGALLR